MTAKAHLAGGPQSATVACGSVRRLVRQIIGYNAHIVGRAAANLSGAGQRHRGYMPDRYVHRNSEQRLRDLVAGLRVVIVNGPRLIRAIKIIVDGSQDRGQFILSGSARFLAIPTLSESLAGRAGFRDLPSA